MKKWIFILLSLSFSGLAAYAQRIVVLAKEDKRFILIGQLHLPSELTFKQNRFFNYLIKRLNAYHPEKTMFYYELDRLSKFGRLSRDFTPDPSITEPSSLFNPKHLFQDNLQDEYLRLKNWDGEALAKISFKDLHRKFHTKDMDTRTREYFTSEEDFKVLDTLIDSILSEKSKEQEEKYRKILGTLLLEYAEFDPQFSPVGPRRSPLKMSQYTNDLNFIEEFLAEEKDYKLFFLQAGDAHVKTITQMLEIEGWGKIIEIESTSPHEWADKLFSLEDPLLKPIFSEGFKTYLESDADTKPVLMPEESWEIIDEDPDASGWDLVSDPNEGASGPAPK